ncbi:Inositol polyphosphate phosphatase, catalytic domain ues [Blomia tropicalis]|nr:Inositol polyphosphate phosphatase, catalytic domain ues [Blomia tropicalis]
MFETRESSSLNYDDDHFSIYLLTYNVNKKSPAQDIQGLLDIKRCGLHDMFVIALEELSHFTLISSDPYLKNFDILFSNYGYVRLRRDRYMITSLSIYVRRDRLNQYYDVLSDSVTTDTYYQKGGIGVRLRYRDVKFAFVAAHLAAHDDFYEKRIKDYWQIIDQLRFTDMGKDNVLDHDFAFFLGDLNFRINELSDKYVHDFISSAQGNTNLDTWLPLLKYDQLNIARTQKRAFSEFEEAPITFPPTFKFFPDTNNYNPKRKPAYTDRILFRNTLKNKVSNNEQWKVTIKMENYASIPEFLFSDHKPVRAIAKISLETFDIKMKTSRRRRMVRAPPEFMAKNIPIGIDVLKDNSLGPSVGANNMADNNDFDDSPSIEEQGLAFSRNFRIEFEPIQNWTIATNQTIYFRVIDIRTDKPVTAEIANLFNALSIWDWIELSENSSRLIEKAGDDVSRSTSSSTISSSKTSSSYISCDENVEQTKQQNNEESSSKSEEQISSTSTTSSTTRSQTESFVSSSSQIDATTFSALFGESAPLFSSGQYILIYRRKNGDVLGLSQPFEINNHPGSDNDFERLEDS